MCTSPMQHCCYDTHDIEPQSTCRFPNKYTSPDPSSLWVNLWMGRITVVPQKGCLAATHDVCAARAAAMSAATDQAGVLTASLYWLSVMGYQLSSFSTWPWLPWCVRWLIRQPAQPQQQHIGGTIGIATRTGQAKSRPNSYSCRSARRWTGHRQRVTSLFTISTKPPDLPSA